MKSIVVVAGLACAALLSAQNAPAGKDQWAPLSFLEGEWDAKTQGGIAGANATGGYVFRKELGGHVLARHTSSSGCKGPTDFNCDHGDLLYIYQDSAQQPLKAIYFDNEGHVIHYTVTTPAPSSAILISDPSAPGPRFRLVYERKGDVISGKFQVQLPGKEWTSYLEWNGAKR